MKKKLYFTVDNDMGEVVSFTNIADALKDCRVGLKEHGIEKMFIYKGELIATKESK